MNSCHANERDKRTSDHKLLVMFIRNPPTLLSPGYLVSITRVNDAKYYWVCAGIRDNQ